MTTVTVSERQKPWTDLNGRHFFKIFFFQSHRLQEDPRQKRGMWGEVEKKDLNRRHPWRSIHNRFVMSLFKNAINKQPVNPWVIPSTLGVKHDWSNKTSLNLCEDRVEPYDTTIPF